VGNLDGKVAVVTGAGHGIGADIARKLSACGAAVVVNYRKAKTEADAVVTEITGKGGKAIAVQADVSRRAEIVAMFETVDRAYGRLDILVNNAAVGGRMMLADITEEKFDRIYATNVKGTIFCAQEAAKRMGQGGRIVNFSSTTAVYPGPGSSVYASSKAAIKMLTDIWAKELGTKGITVNTVTPGATSPGMMDKFPKEVWEQVARNSPFNRVGRASDVAAVVAFLCAEEAAWVSGQQIVVNGAASS